MTIDDRLKKCYIPARSGRTDDRPDVSSGRKVRTPFNPAMDWSWRAANGGQDIARRTNGHVERRRDSWP